MVGGRLSLAADRRRPKALCNEVSRSPRRFVNLDRLSNQHNAVEEGSLYPALRRLEKQKLIKGSWKTTVNGRRARYYELLPAGQKRLSEVEQQWETLTKSVSKVLRYV
jgi:PadR family transcriptional regulator PadR